jgi:hypothetical protein
MKHLLCYPPKGAHMGTAIKEMSVEVFPFLEKYLDMVIDRVVVVENGEVFLNPNIKNRQLELF